MALRNAILRHLKVPVTNQSQIGFIGSIRSFSSHDDHLSRQDVADRVLDVVKSFPKVDPAKVTPDVHFQKDLGLDSLDTVERNLSWKYLTKKLTKSNLALSPLNTFTIIQCLAKSFGFKANDDGRITGKDRSITPSLSIADNTCIDCDTCRWMVLASGSNQLGEIPGSLLDLSFNQLSGELPSELSQMMNLVGLSIQQNNFSGSIEDLFCSSLAWKVEAMNFSDNFFSGGLPNSLGNLSYLTYLDLHKNRFTGEIPSDISNLMQLEYLDVSENSFSGDIPTKIYELPPKSISGSRSREPLSINVAMFEQPLLKVSLADIVEATDHF